MSTYFVFRSIYQISVAVYETKQCNQQDKLPLYRVLLAYLCCIFLYILLIFVGSCRPGTPYLDIATDCLMLASVILWFLKWRERLRVHTIYNYSSLLLKPEAISQKRLLRRLVSLYCKYLCLIF